MKNYLILKNLFNLIKEYIFIFLTATIIIFVSSSKSLSIENIFTINNVKVKGVINLNFSREKYLNKGFKNSFLILMNKILLTRDTKKVSNIQLKEIKNLINSFKIIEEKYNKNKYIADYQISYNEEKVKKFLRKKNISFSKPDKISSVFFPILIINDEIKNFYENFFYKNWNEVEIQNELINFILPLEDLDHVAAISKSKESIENLDLDNLVNKYNVENYVLALMDYKSNKLNVYLKIKFNNKKISKNIFYNIENIEDNLLLDKILIDLKLQITDIWKEENLINLLMPLSIKIRYDHKNLKQLNAFKNTLEKISTIHKHNLKEFSVNSSFYKIYYYGNPKKLKYELLKYGYKLNNDQGYWQIYLNE